MAAARHGLVIVLLAALLTPVASARARPVQIGVTPVPLDAADPARARAGRLEYLGGLHLRSDDDDFGGLSGLVVEGDRAIMVSDKGNWVLARLRHDATGRLTGMTDVEIGPLLDQAGRPVSRRLGDAEAVRRLDDGRLLVSFERIHRLWAYAPGTDPLAARPAPLPVPRELAKADSNGGLEAVVEMAPGQRLALSESLRDPSGDLVGWYLAGRGMRAVRYATDGAFVPTDLARLPDGDLLVLERRFSFLGGVAGQVRLIPYAQLGGTRLEPVPVGRLEPPLAVDNMEGLAVVARGDDMLVYVLSDDNFNVLQRTLLLQFRLLPAGE